MEKNIFEGAKFGDKFLTRDGRIAILQQISICSTNKTEDGSIQDIPLYPVLFTSDDEISCGLDGYVFEQFEGHYKKSKDDIVSRYKKPIVETTKVQSTVDEKKLDELAYEQQEKTFCSFAQHCSGIGIGCMLVNNSYKDGYRKAKEE